MLSFAICDDEPNMLNDTATLVERYLQARPALSGHVELFCSCEELLDRSNKAEGADIYILDILMPGLSGIAAGQKLRERGNGGEIIYLTNSNDFAADSYDVRAFFYLLKPVDENKLFEVLDGAVDKLERRRNSAVLVNTADGVKRIRLEHIRYVERVGRFMRYYCINGIVDSQSIRTSFREMAASLLSDRRFYLCGASYVLNLQHVAGVRGQSALLDDGQTVVLPRASATEFKKAWGRFWLEEDPL